MFAAMCVISQRSDPKGSCYGKESVCMGSSSFHLKFDVLCTILVFIFQTEKKPNKYRYFYLYKQHLCKQSAGSATKKAKKISNSHLKGQFKFIQLQMQNIYHKLKFMYIV